MLIYNNLVLAHYRSTRFISQGWNVASNRRVRVMYEFHFDIIYRPPLKDVLVGPTVRRNAASPD